MSLKRKAAIVGIHEHETRYSPDKSAYQLIAESARAALDDAGLNKEDVDGLFCYGPEMAAIKQAEYLNIRPKYLDSTSEGGTSFLMHAHHAASAIAAGVIDVALIVYGMTPKSGGIAIGTGGAEGPPPPTPDSFMEPFGTTLISRFALAAQRHMHQYGTTPEQLAAIAVAQRDFASRNPHALFHDPITMEDVLNSPIISSPLHRLDCCIISDGAGAVVMTSAQRARDCRKKPVWLLGSAETVLHLGPGDRDFVTWGAADCAPRAFAMAGVTHDDIDVAQLYDAFTIVVLGHLEDVGFCKKGEAGAFVEAGHTRRGGKLPVNTDGGGLSSNQPGERGIYLIIEAVRQLRGEGSDNQVPDARIALAHGLGGESEAHCSATLILVRD